jgi:hypothetical protein
MSYRCIPIATSIAERFRDTLHDDFGNHVRHFPSDDSGYPCRHCLKETILGENVLLGSYNQPRPSGFYWSASPIFLHADACPHHDQDNVLPPIVRNRLISLRTYDADDQIIYGLGDVVDGKVADALLDQCLADPRAKFVAIHTARPGCLLCLVERA